MKTEEQGFVELPVDFFSNPQLMMFASNGKPSSDPYSSDPQAISVYMQLALICLQKRGAIPYEEEEETLTKLIGQRLTEKRVAKIIAALKYYGLAYHSEIGLVVLMQREYMGSTY